MSIRARLARNARFGLRVVLKLGGEVVPSVLPAVTRGAITLPRLPFSPRPNVLETTENRCHLRARGLFGERGASARAG